MFGVIFLSEENRILYPALRVNTSCDVLIIGGGLCGALCSYFCAERGIDAVLAEGETLGGGNTSNMTADITPDLFGGVYGCSRRLGTECAEELYSFFDRTLEKMEKTDDRCGRGSGFERKSSFVFTDRKRDLRRIAGDMRLLYHGGMGATLFRYTDCPELFPFEYISGVYRSGAAATADPVGFTLSAAAYASLNGCRVFESTAVASVLETAEGYTAVTDRGAEIRTRFIIDCRGVPEEPKTYSRLVAVSDKVKGFCGWYELANLCDSYSNGLRIACHGDRVIATLKLPSLRPLTRRFLDLRSAWLTVTVKNMLFNAPELRFRNVYLHSCIIPSDGIPHIVARGRTVSVENVCESSVLYAYILAERAVCAITNEKTDIPELFGDIRG